NRTVIGVDGRAAWGARVKSAATGAGTNVPAYIVPLACTGRNPGGTPPDSVSSTASGSVMGVLATAGAPERGWGRSKRVQSRWCREFQPFSPVFRPRPGLSRRPPCGDDRLKGEGPLLWSDSV